MQNAMSQCNLFGLSSDHAAAQVRQVVQVVNGWQAHFAACGVSSADMDSLAQRIDDEPLAAQRRAF